MWYETTAGRWINLDLITDIEGLDGRTYFYQGERCLFTEESISKVMNKIKQSYKINNLIRQEKK